MIPIPYRFALYGFLKNQRYFEPFLLLVFLDKGLSFLQIGTLMSVREAAVVVCEIPSGALADLHGRRRVMVASFVAYIVSFFVFAAAGDFVALSAAMVLFGLGDACRSGTHKAMIFTWLRSQGRQSEGTEFYGYTRSWSKYGSAVSTVLAAVLVFFSNSYAWLFYASVAPYMLGIANLLSYPAAVEDPSRHQHHFFQHLWRTFTASVRSPVLRRLYAESMGFEGLFHAAKDYIQPIVAVALVGTAFLGGDGGSGLSGPQRNAVVLAPVYIALFLLAGTASRRSHRFASRYASNDAAANSLWWFALVLFALIGIGGYFSWSGALVVAFVALHVAQNLWRPILVSRFDRHGGDWQGATLLSVESQARRLATLMLAPVIGWAVDTVRYYGWGGEFWPIGILGVAIAGTFVTRRR